MVHHLMSFVSSLTEVRGVISNLVFFGHAYACSVSMLLLGEQHRSNRLRVHIIGLLS
jgi:hypothetical protein